MTFVVKDASATVEVIQNILIQFANKYNAMATLVRPPRNAIEMPNGNESTKVRRDFISLIDTIQESLISFGNAYEINVHDLKNWSGDMLSDFQSFLDKLLQYGVKTWHMKPNRIIVEFGNEQAFRKVFDDPRPLLELLRKTMQRILLVVDEDKGKEICVEIRRAE